MVLYSQCMIQEQIYQQKFVENVKENIHLHIYKTLIPRNVRLAEAPSYGIPIHMYDGKSAGAIAYKNLAQEVIEKNN